MNKIKTARIDRIFLFMALMTITCPLFAECLPGPEGLTSTSTRGKCSQALGVFYFERGFYAYRLSE